MFDSINHRKQQGRTKSSGTRKGMMIQVHPQVQKPNIPAAITIHRTVNDNTKQPPRFRVCIWTTAWLSGCFWRRASYCERVVPNRRGFELEVRKIKEAGILEISDNDAVSALTVVLRGVEGRRMLFWPLELAGTRSVRDEGAIVSWEQVWKGSSYSIRIWKVWTPGNLIFVCFLKRAKNGTRCAEVL